jgi:hypothetical protein
MLMPRARFNNVPFLISLLPLPLHDILPLLAVLNSITSPQTWQTTTTTCTPSRPRASRSARRRRLTSTRSSVRLLVSTSPPRTHTTTDQNDESLQKWKASLGLGQGTNISDPNDPRKCIILSLGLEVEGRPDIIIDLRSPGAVEALQSKPFTIKEGATFRMKAQFKVQHEILAGLKYLQKVSRVGISSKMQEMMVCFSSACG